jgi:hypothetical protein
MEHNEAIQISAAEKYVLRELSDDQRDAYEEHFFDCSQCAADIKAAMIFADASREIFADDLNRPVSEIDQLHGRPQSRWLHWLPSLRPAFALPAFAALAFVLLIGYYFMFSATRTTEIAAVSGQFAGPDTLQSSVHLLPEQRRGSADLPVVKVRPAERFTLDFDFIPSQKFDSYRGELQDAAGRLVLPVTLVGDMAMREVNVVVPGGLVHPGKYTLAFAGVSAAPSASSAKLPVQTFTFIVEFLR